MIMPVLTSADLMPLLPEIVVVLGAFALLMLDLFVDERRRFLVHAGGGEQHQHRDLSLVQIAGAQV